ncbi:uncharacterized protein LOC114881264 [Osmia bicornis bicornis]|uniref:uncharacterized protein LOC114881264 n=1 Tax=Osmia bicornis bicornis TaxID=1437191 RepID=UPI0010F88A1C|nr:uncharacterized protein LOC114881264 [Osmia bicornis bicornis]
MGDVPADRLTPVRAFYCSGVDYAGPYYVKDRIRSRTLTKTYMCVFVCFSTKAVHLELAGNMTSDAFLNCLQRFIARRGKCAKLYSDNGSNFVGARNELNELKELLSNQTHHDRVADFLAGDSIQWHMIPPHGPNFGGLWESVVGCAKCNLKRILDNSHLTYEELNTVLIQVEACLNSRPLSPLSDDPYDLSPLTPAHFLIRKPLSNLPQRNLVELKTNRLDRCQRMQQILQHFWNRWRIEYLHLLQQRYKWRRAMDPNLVPGSMVLIHEDNLPPTRWRLGRIKECHPGKDGIVRVVTIHTAAGD